MSRDFEEKLNPLIPMVVEQSSKGERAYDIYSRLLKDENICRKLFPLCSIAQRPLELKYSFFLQNHDS